MRTLAPTVISLVSAATGCASTTEPPTPAVVSPAPPADATAPPRAAEPTTAPKPSAPRQLTVLFQGACPKATIGHLGDQPAFSMEQNVVYFDGNEPKELFRMNGSTMYGLRGMVGEVGGPDPAHAWIMQHTPSRGAGYDGYVLFAARKWKNTVYAKGEHASEYRAHGILENPDGSLWSYATEAWHSMESTGTEHFTAWSANGDLIDAHVPKGDMAMAQRLATGELVAGDHGKKGQVVLRRWSPAKAVDDLVAPDGLVSETPVETRLGATRAVLATEAPRGKLALYSYNGMTLERVGLSASPTAKDSWLLTKGDELFVTAGDEIVIRRADGSTAREKAPEPGTLAQDRLHVWWLAKSGILYAHDSPGWTAVPLPEGPWSHAEHGPTKLEYVQTVGVETVIGTSHTEPGKTKRPITVRTVYSSVSHGEPARCGSPLRPGEVGRPAAK